MDWRRIVMGMLRSFRRPIILAVASAAMAATALSVPVQAGDDSVKVFQDAAYAGRFADGIAALEANVRTDAGDVEAQFGLGAMRFFGAMADLQKGMRAHTTPIKETGRGARGGMLGLFVIPMGRMMGGVTLVPPNPNATPMTYAKLRELLTKFANDLKAAEATLAKVGDRPVKIALRPFDVAFDLDQNGSIEPNERILASLLGQGRRMRSVNFGAELAFDTADASWLRGYTNVLLGTVNFLLAFDFERSYAVGAHHLYGDQATAFGAELARQADLGRPRDEIQTELDAVREKIRSVNRDKSSRKDIRDLRKQIRELEDKPSNVVPRQILEDALKNMVANQDGHRDTLRALNKERRRLSSELRSKGQGWIYDAVASLHTLSWDVLEPPRLEAARQHFLRVMTLNQNTWRLVRAETDDDREWLPNAQQTAPFNSKPLTDEVIDSWLATTVLAAQVLKGEKLLPHPRFQKGFNLKRLMTTAKRVDFVLLATGHDLVAHLEDGEIVDGKTWEAITQPMGRHVGQYALWFN